MIGIIISLLPVIFGIGTPTFSGSLKINFDYFVYPDAGQFKTLEFFYEVPFTSLAFVKNDNHFIARYRLAVEVFDRRRNIVATEVWDRRLTVREYLLTFSRDSCTNELIRFSIPTSAFEAMVKVYDLQSERWAMVRFGLEGKKDDFRLRLLKSGLPDLSRIYGMQDTIEIIAELIGESSKVVADVDSILWVVKKGKRTVLINKQPIINSSQGFVSRLVIPVVDTNRMMTFSSGGYVVEAQLAAQNRQRTIEFQVALPFYYDDSIWALKVDQLLYIATPEQMGKLKRTPKSMREQSWIEFWQEKDPNRSTELNELENEYFARIDYCEKRFGKGDRGYKSDRARIYVLYGSPDQIESRPFEIDRPAEEFWYYYQSNLTFVFIDRYGLGEYILKQ